MKKKEFAQTKDKNPRLIFWNLRTTAGKVVCSNVQNLFIGQFALKGRYFYFGANLQNRLIR